MDNDDLLFESNKNLCSFFNTFISPSHFPYKKKEEITKNVSISGSDQPNRTENTHNFVLSFPFPSFHLLLFLASTQFFLF